RPAGATPYEESKSITISRMHNPSGLPAMAAFIIRPMAAPTGPLSQDFPIPPNQESAAAGRNWPPTLLCMKVRIQPFYMLPFERGRTRAVLQLFPAQAWPTTRCTGKTTASIAARMAAQIGASFQQPRVDFLLFPAMLAVSR